MNLQTLYNDLRVLCKKYDIKVITATAPPLRRQGGVIHLTGENSGKTLSVTHAKNR